MDYDKAEALIQKGMQAAEEKAQILRPYSLIRQHGTNTWPSAMRARKELWPFRSL